MDIVLISVLMGGLLVAIFYMLIKGIEARYPPILVRQDKGNISGLYKYRVLGNMIIEANLLQLMSGVYKLKGLVNSLDYSIENGKRIYRGYLVNDFIFGYKENKRQMEVGRIDLVGTDFEVEYLENGKPKRIKLKINNDFIIPLRIDKDSVSKLEVKEVENGKQIAVGFINSIREEQDYSKASSPIMTAIISVLPVAIVTIIIFIGLYMILTGSYENVLKILNKMDIIAQRLG